LDHVNIRGLMGMASFTEDREQVSKEFRTLKLLFEKYSSLQISNSQLQILSMGMSDDYDMAINQGSTMVRIGSLIFGRR
jgi:PLP dependent protein